MGNPKPPTPTPTKPERLKLFGRRGTATARDLVDDLKVGRSTSTIAATVRRTEDEGLLRVHDARRRQRYAAARTEAETYASMLEGIDRRFGRSLVDHVRSFLGSRRPTRAEVEEVKKLLDGKAGR